MVQNLFSEQSEDQIDEEKAAVNVTDLTQRHNNQRTSLFADREHFASSKTSLELLEPETNGKKIANSNMMADSEAIQDKNIAFELPSLSRFRQKKKSLLLKLRNDLKSI